MKLSSQNSSLKKLATDLLVVPLAPADVGGKRSRGKKDKAALLSSSFEFADLDRELGGTLKAALKREGFKGKAGESACYCFPALGRRFRAVLLVGWDAEPESEFESLERYRSLGSSIAAQAAQLKLRRAALLPRGLLLGDAARAEALLEGIELSGYTFDKYKSKPSSKNAGGLRELVLLSDGRISAGAARRGRQLSSSTALARDLINLPAGDCTPRDMVSRCRALARQRGLKIQVYNAARLKQLGAGLLLAVGQGSSAPPFLVKLTYRPRGGGSETIALVGKGVTFDSGGLSIKLGDGMATMKCDMSGAAAVIGAMDALAVLKPRAEVRAYVPLAENMINGRAVRPGDVVRALNGKTVEILNTDAEGRLILADALSLAVKEKADIIVDAATLTGACVVALGADYAGLFSDDDELAQQLLKAGDRSGEGLWRLPLAKSYRDSLKGAVGDLRNISTGRMGGAITAALFLREFVGRTPWAHIDIAGPAFTQSDSGYRKKGGVGFGVRTLTQFVLQRS